MEPPIPPLLYALLLLIGMLFLMEIGRRFGIRRRPKESEGERGGLGTVEGAVFALFGLMVAFTFSGAATRVNEKRMLIAEEVNCIETAYLRLHLLSPNPNGQARLLK
jgi:prepilin signal peptidase PulO-like enzyme (type II secretory pathway)